MVASSESGTEIKSKMKFTGKVVKTSLAGAVIDIGTAIPAVLHISQIPLDANGEAVKRLEDVIQVGQDVEVWVKRARQDHIELSMIRPLDLEWREIKQDMVVKGKVVRIEKFGAFVEIGAERPGLVHISEMAYGYVKFPTDVVKEGDEIEAQVLEVNRKKKQIKLSMKALQAEPVEEIVVEEKEIRQVEAFKPREKPARPKKDRKPRNQDREGGEFLLNLSDSSTSQGEAEPTAMEIALREAMDKAKIRKKEHEEKAKRTKSVSKEQEDLLSRTLERKVPTS
jgi:small subunit ribosomal protein S1